MSELFCLYLEISSLQTAGLLRHEKAILAQCLMFTATAAYLSSQSHKLVLGSHFCYVSLHRAPCPDFWNEGAAWCKFVRRLTSKISSCGMEAVKAFLGARSGSWAWVWHLLIQMNNIHFCFWGFLLLQNFIFIIYFFARTLNLLHPKHGKNLLSWV